MYNTHIHYPATHTYTCVQRYIYIHMHGLWLKIFCGLLKWSKLFATVQVAEILATAESSEQCQGLTNATLVYNLSLVYRDR